MSVGRDNIYQSCSPMRRIEEHLRSCESGESGESGESVITSVCCINTGVKVYPVHLRLALMLFIVI